MTKKNKWGRPSEMSEEKIKKLEEAFALDCSIGEACFYADISKVTYHNWVNKNPELLNRFDALREKPVLMARQTVVRALKDNPDMALKYLERKRKKEFSTRAEQEITGANWWPVAIQKVERSIMDNNYDTKTESN